MSPTAKRQRGSERGDLLLTVPLFAALPKAARERVVAAGVVRHFAAGATIFRAGERATSLYVILDGRVRVLRVRSGRQRVIHSEERGGTLGEVPLFEGGTLPATAVCATEVRCLAVSGEALLGVLREHPDVALLFLQRLSRRVRVLVERIDRISTQSVASRVAGHLLARTSPSSAVVSLGMTQAALAEEIGTAREVLVRALAQLRRAGAIAAERRGWYRITNAAQLRRMAQG